MPPHSVIEISRIDRIFDNPAEDGDRHVRTSLLKSYLKSCLGNGDEIVVDSLFVDPASVGSGTDTQPQSQVTPFTAPIAPTLEPWFAMLMLSLLANGRNRQWPEDGGEFNPCRPADADDPPKFGGLPPRRLQKIIDHIEAHLGDDISMALLAELACVSEFHFIRCFKQSVGLPPHRYIMQRRVERAKTLLLETTDTVVQIALACGFADQSHMSTHFRRAIGTTPARFRRDSL